jgi:chemotaxis family two-component system response regulator PixG
MASTSLPEILRTLNKNQDGDLILRHPNGVWTFYIIKGQVLYAKDDSHSVRRWDRALKQHNPNWNWSIEISQLPDHQAWECQMLDRGINQEKLSLLRAKLIIRTVVQECLFELSRYPDLESDWKPEQKEKSSLQFVALSTLETPTIANSARRMQQQWQDAGLHHLNPNLSPVLKQEVGHAVLPISQSYFTSKLTLWDIAWQLKKSIVDIACELLPLEKEGILQFQTVPDLQLAAITGQIATSPPIEKSTPSTSHFNPHSTITSSATVNKKQALIACIDDSPVLAHTLNKILIPAGYKTLNIQEPMRGFAQLIEHKPNLILLDLQLPNADGYSVCKFLRDTPVFAKTPIIILTARNTTIDRAKAKIVGATEFLSKPPQPDELLQVVQKYL